MPRFPYDRGEEGDGIWGTEAVSEVPVYSALSPGG